MLRRNRSLVYCFLLLVVFGGFFSLSVKALSDRRHPRVETEIAVALPPLVEVFFAFGDRFLAANFAVVRAQITDPSKMQPEEFKVLATVQEHAALMNPRHEDNYYSAAAILSWYGQLNAAQSILKVASVARPFDYQPSLYYGFNLLHFKHDPVAASQWLRQAAPGLPTEKLRLTMEDLAARWVSTSSDIDVAIQMTEAMAKEARRDDFREYLQKRVSRLRGLKVLRAGAERYRQQTGERLVTLDQLVRSKIIQSLPVEPFGVGYALNAEGIPIVAGDKQ